MTDKERMRTCEFMLDEIECNEKIIENAKKKIKIYEFMLDNDVSINEILDVIIESNNLIGVGIVSLQDQIEEHLKSHFKGEYTNDTN
ncbi:MAG: hypothetical protein CMI54_00585 [Parcubacteria group bacterium]|nr:hypothetical protein [Parcubacteria group bacterium]|tara:strand:+ start:827 stop:1087 length:261 start_codon:yes stop_codon:yes gene_type:complete